MIHRIAGGEDAREGGRRRDRDVASLVEVDLAAQDVGARLVPDGDEDAGGVELALLAGDGVAQGDGSDLLLTVDGADLAVPGELDPLVGQGTLGHDL